MNKDWLDITVLEDYLEGKLDPRTMNRVEREALEDPFVAEALAGLSASPKKSLESISLLQKQLQERVAEQHHIRKASIITWQRLSIAAAAAVLFISVGIIFWMKQINYQDTLARKAKQPKEVEVNIASKEFKDSIAASATQVATVPAPKTATPSKAIEEAIKAAKGNTYAASTAKKKARLNNPPIASAQEQPARLSEAYSAKAISLAAGKVATTIRGKVLDEASGQPLENAAIYVKGTDIRTFTNNVGEFSVTSDTLLKNPEITAAYIGYENAVAQAKVNESNVLVLKENKGALNEVVIRGYQKRSREQTTGSSYIVTGKEVKDVPVAQVEQLLQGRVAGLNIQNNTGEPSTGNNSATPSRGWNKFRAYLTETNRYRQEAVAGQTAEYKFSIKRGRPVNITVVKGISKNYDEEAIRLIENGPRWKLSDAAHPEVSVVLKF